VIAGVVALGSLAFAQDKDEPQKPAEPAKVPAKSQEKSEDTKPVTAETAKSVLDFTMKDIDGNDVPLSKYKGKTLLIVNVASKCGMTPQYEQLEMLHEKYGAKGLNVLAFPANNFGGQEPGTNEEIKSFCKTKYSVGFDLFSKVSVKGDDSCELYKFLTSKEKNGKLGGEVKWNFTKFLVDRDGKLIQRFEPRVKPDADEVTSAIETTLEAKGGKKD
jgi:glutathione peroxidase